MSFEKAAKAIREFCAFDISTDFFEKIDTSYKSRVLTPDCIHLLAQQRSSLPITYIDGGNQFIVKSSSFCVAYIRTAACLWKEGKFQVKKHDFILIVQAQSKHISCSYLALDVEPDFLPNLPKEFEKNDPLLVKTESFMQVQKVVQHIRKVAEYETALLCAIEHKNSLIVMDGALLAPYTESLVKKILPHATLVGVSKTTSLLTTSGYPLAMYISRLSETEPFYTDPLINEYVGVHIAKLHPKSEFVLRIDMSECDYAKVFGVLSTQSLDVTTIGYPYGLVKADESARVTNEEVLYFKTRVVQKLDSLTLRQLRQLEHTADTHDLLDTIKF